MGVWGVGPFENDVAADWAFEFADADIGRGLALVRDALVAAADIGPAEYLDGDLGTNALAAAELVALINGKAIQESAYNDEPAPGSLGLGHHRTRASLPWPEEQWSESPAVSPSWLTFGGKEATRSGERPWLSN